MSDDQELVQASTPPPQIIMVAPTVPVATTEMLSHKREHSPSPPLPASRPASSASAGSSCTPAAEMSSLSGISCAAASATVVVPPTIQPTPPPAAPRLSIAPSPLSAMTTSAGLLMHRVPGVPTPAAPAIGPLPTPTTSRAPTPMALDVGAPLFGASTPTTGLETPPWTPNAFRNPGSMDSLSISELMSLPTPPPLALISAATPATSFSSSSSTQQQQGEVPVVVVGPMLAMTPPLPIVPVAVVAKRPHNTFSVIQQSPSSAFSSFPIPSSSAQGGYYSGSEWSDSEPTPRKPPAQRPKLMMPSSTSTIASTPNATAAVPATTTTTTTTITNTAVSPNNHTSAGPSPSSAATDVSAMLMPPPAMAPRKSVSALGAGAAITAAVGAKATARINGNGSGGIEELALFTNAPPPHVNPASSSSSQATPESLPAGDPPLPLLMSGVVIPAMASSSSASSSAIHHSLPIAVQSQQQHQQTSLTIASSIGKRKLTLENADDYSLLTEKQHCSLCGKPFVDGQNVRTLPGCGHTFHVGCIDHHLEVDHCCPIDKQDILSTLHR